MDKVKHGYVCGYCGKETEAIDSKEIYGKHYGLARICRPCNAYVGCHDGTDKPLGRVANKELRRWKQEAHRWLDPLWKAKMARGTKKGKARGAAYRWLADCMGIEAKDCHIGMFTLEQCKLAVKIIRSWHLSKDERIKATNH